ncbi:Gfo/Idh/MocA family protein [Planctomicrobium sp. SH661]|uniref:Gfo/Idh/MocA family protein n=1 Tax=Planctomicrobium sp. SH661 TaxID=3448124 RepID=UPI003F5C8AA1
MRRPVRYGLIGYGAWGKRHAEAICKAPDAQLVAIAASSARSTEAAAIDHPQAAVHRGYYQLLERKDLDAVSIVLPSHLHHPVAKEALKRGLHVLLEKPMGLSLKECDDLILLSRENERHLVVGHELRISSLWGRVKELISSGFMGSPLYVLVELSRNSYRRGAEEWRYDLNRVGSWVLEEPIHFFDLARWYLESTGDPVSIYATANSKQIGHPELQDNFSAIMHTASGAYAVISQTLSAFEHHQTVKVTGTQGAIWASWSGASDRTRQPTYALRVFNGNAVEDISIPKTTGEIFELEDQLSGFTRLIQGEPIQLCTAEEGRWSVAMCLAAQESIDSGRVVEFKQPCLHCDLSKGHAFLKNY